MSRENQKQIDFKKSDKEVGSKSFIKKFSEWFKLKIKLNKNFQPPSFSEREIWNCHFGLNIGYEVNGKKSKFLRPVLVFKKISKETFLGIPLTTKLKTGSWYYKSFIKGKEGRFVFSQVRVFDAKRLNNRIEKIKFEEFRKVKRGFISFLEDKNYPPKREVATSVEIDTNNTNK
jgi:hypothetical protein